MTEAQRKSLIMAAQHQVKQVKQDYKQGNASLETLKAVNKAMEHMMMQIQIEYNK